MGASTASYVKSFMPIHIGAQLLLFGASPGCGSVV